MAKGTGCPSLVLANCKSVAVGFWRNGGEREVQKGTEGKKGSERKRKREEERKKHRSIISQQTDPDVHRFLPLASGLLEPQSLGFICKVGKPKGVGGVR